MRVDRKQAFLQNELPAGVPAPVLRRGALLCALVPAEGLPSSDLPAVAGAKGLPSSEAKDSHAQTPS